MKKNYIILLACAMYATSILAQSTLPTSTVHKINLVKSNKKDSIKLSKTDSIDIYIDSTGITLKITPKLPVLIKKKEAIPESTSELYNQSNFFRHNGPNLLNIQGWMMEGSQLHFYLDARYGYEASSTGALYVGWYFPAKKPQTESDYSRLIVMAGAVVGNINGCSFDATVEFKKEWGYLKSENEYVASTDSSHGPRFFYNWSKLTFNMGSIYNAHYSFGLGAQWRNVFVKGEMPGNFFYIGPVLSVEPWKSKTIAFDLFDYYDFMSKSWVYTFALSIH